MLKALGGPDGPMPNSQPAVANGAVATAAKLKSCRLSINKWCIDDRDADDDREDIVQAGASRPTPGRISRRTWWRRRYSDLEQGVAKLLLTV